MEFTKPESFAKQIVIYINEKRFQEATNLSNQFVQKFPNEMIAHFLLSKCAFWLEDFAQAANEGRRAFNLAQGKKDLIICAIMASTAYYKLGKYAEGMEILKKVEEGEKTEELERTLVIFSLAMKDEKEVQLHIDELFKIRKEAAEEMIAQFLNE